MLTPGTRWTITEIISKEIHMTETLIGGGIQEAQTRADRLRAGNFIHIENVTKIYGDKTVLADIDLSIPRGELLCLVGPSGCGKSTLLRLILGQELPTSGILELNH